MSDININIRLSSKAAEQGLNAFGAAATGAGKQLNLFEKITQQARRSLDSFYGNLGANLAFRAFNGIISAIGNTITNVREFETALIGVGKTTGLSGQQLQQFGLRIEELSKKIPVSSVELLGLARTAAQLGVQGSDNIEKFTETMARLAFATDVVGEDGAIAFARILNLTNESVNTVDRLGSSLVELGNNFAATERQIIEVATEVAKGGARFGLTAEQVLGLSTAMAALGVESEVAGSTTQKIFATVEKAIGTGGSELKKFTNLLGLNREEFVNLFKTNPQGFFEELVNSLARSRKGGKQLSTTLAELGFNDLRVTKTLGPLVDRTDLLASAINKSSQAYKDNIALNKESDAAFESLDGSLQGLSNSWVAFTNTILRFVVPAIKLVVDGLKAIIDIVNQSQAIQAILIGITIGLGAMAVAVIANTATWTALTAAATAAWVAMGGPITLIIAGVTALTFAVLKLTQATDQERLAALESARLRKLETGASTEAIDQQILAVKSKIKLEEQNKESIVGTNTVLAQNTQNNEDLNKALYEQIGLRLQLNTILGQPIASGVLRPEASPSEAGAIDQEARDKDELDRLKNQGLLRNQILLEQKRAEFLQDDTLNEERRQFLLEQEANRLATELETRQLALTQKLGLEKEAQDLEFKNQAAQAKRTNDLAEKSAKAEVDIQKRLAEQKGAIISSAFALGAAIAKNGSKEQFIIQKAAALAEIALARGKSLALVPAMVAPIIDPTPTQSIRTAAAAKLIAGINLQAALGAATVIASAIQGFQDGGIVGGSSFSGDRVLARVNSGEMILNREQQANLFSMANGAETSSGRSGDLIIQIDGEEVFKVVSRKVAEGRLLGEGGV